MSHDEAIAIGLIEAPKIIANRIRALKRELSDDRRAYKRQYRLDNLEALRAKDRKRRQVGRRARERERRIAAVFAGHRFDGAANVRM